MQASPALDVEYLQGIHVIDTILWLDALREADLCFLSHASQERVGPHRKVLLTEATAALLSPRMGKNKTLLTPYRRRFALGGLDLTLHPSGHMPGAAQIQVERGDSRLVYTGDFQLSPARTTEAAYVVECDVLVMQATYGAPGQEFPDRQETSAAILSWVTRTLSSGQQPVLFAAPLGPAQELIHLLADNGLGVRAHQSIYQVCKSYDKLGIELPGVRSHRQQVGNNEVIVYPLGLRGSKAVNRLKNTQTAAATGRALDPDATRALGVDRAFPFCLHADYPALARYAKESQAEKIYLVGESAMPLSADLRNRGMNAWPLLPPEQMELFRSQHRGQT